MTPSMTPEVAMKEDGSMTPGEMMVWAATYALAAQNMKPGDDNDGAAIIAATEAVVVLRQSWVVVDQWNPAASGVAPRFASDAKLMYAEITGQERNR